MALRLTETTKLTLVLFAKSRGINVDQALRFLLKAYLLPGAAEDDPIDSYGRRNVEMMEVARKER